MKKKERKKVFRGKGEKGKKKEKKSSAGFKPVRLVLLVVLSVQREGVVGRIGFCAQVLGRRCRCGPWQAVRPLISQSSRFVLGSRSRQIQRPWP